MFELAPRPAVMAAWAVAVLGAVAVLVGPLTPCMLAVEVLGAVTCLVASGVLAVVYFRH